jgi:hypothetical protein
MSLDLAGGQVFPNCTVYSGWWDGIGPLIRHGKSRLVADDWKDNVLRPAACRGQHCDVTCLSAMTPCAALPRADARKPPLVTARHCEIRC